MSSIVSSCAESQATAALQVMVCILRNLLSESVGCGGATERCTCLSNGVCWHDEDESCLR